MEKAIRVVSIERGHDPRDFTLAAFGGAGGLHACELASALGIPRVIVPAMPGALSAYGILVSDVVKDYSRTVLWRVKGKLPGDKFAAEFKRLEARAGSDFCEEKWKGRVQFQRSVDVRYKGQGFELNVPYSDNLLRAFEQEHQRRYGYSYSGRELELVTLRLRATVKSPAVEWKNDGVRKVVQAPERAPVFSAGKFLATSIYERDDLTEGKIYSGPAIVTEYSATTVVPPKTKFQLDRAGNLVISLKK
jgi:N-methylhydantoinase A